jgi:hypothetical protein
LLVLAKNQSVNMRTRINAGWTIFRLIWWNHRLGFGLLLALALICGFVLFPLISSFSGGPASDATIYLPMGLSLFLVFLFCGFTETDRKGNFEGYPSRLFTLPFSTGILITAPVLFSFTVVLTTFSLWTVVILPTSGRHLPLAWPCAYLGAGMVCYQSILWSLARWRIARLLVLGVGGTIFATSWMLFRQDFEREVTAGLVPVGVSPRTILYLVLAALTVIALIAAYWTVESDRRGGHRQWQAWRKLTEGLMDLLPRRTDRFQSAGQAQFWYEWRRHSLVFLLCTAGVLLIIMVPAIVVRPIPAGWTALCLQGVIATPIVLAFALGKGFGKADMWSKNPALPLFLATRPLKNTERIAAKMKAAALAAIGAWAVVLISTPLWLRYCCDARLVDAMLRHAARIYPGIGFSGAVTIFASVGVVLTWRFLIGGLYLGLSGKHWVLALAGVGVFIAFFGAISLLAGLSNNPELMQYVLSLPAAWTWALAALLVLKVSVAVKLADFALRRGLLTSRALSRYFALWLVVTLALFLAVWFSDFEDRSLRTALIFLALLAVPLLRVSCAPLALAWARGQPQM